MRESKRNEDPNVSLIQKLQTYLSSFEQQGSEDLRAARFFSLKNKTCTSAEQEGKWQL